MDPTWQLFTPFVIVAVFALVQSVFGVGLLVFGTPTLLLAGYPFDRALALLLPASAAISAAQLLRLKDRRTVQWDYLRWTVPFVVLTLGLVLHFEWRLNLRRIVGVLLLVSAVLRWSPLIQHWLRGLLARHLRVYLAAMGAVHGASNLGGGLLTIMASTLHPDKEEARANIAAVYLAFASIQLAVLAVFKPAAFASTSALTPLVALGVFALGNRLFRLASPTGYQSMMSAFMALYGVLMFA